MRNTVEKVSNEGSRVRFLLFTTIATTSTAAAAAASNPKMPHHTMSQGTLNKRVTPKNSEIGLCIFNTIPSHAFLQRK